MGVTSIQWTDRTWSPLRVRVRGDAAEIARAKGYASLVQIAEKMAGHVGPHCEHVSDGCKLCYSGTTNRRCLPSNGTGLPFDRRSRDLVEPFVDEKILTQPLHWKEPQRIFVENQSDLFGDWVTDEEIDRVFAVMALSPQHTFQVLTKRPERMLQWLRRTLPAKMPGKSTWGAYENVAYEVACWYLANGRIGNKMPHPPTWPLPNVWLGISCEDQKTADERIPLLLQTPAALRFVSYEPALGPVDWYRCGGLLRTPGPGSMSIGQVSEYLFADALDWVIVGGESGPGARPFDIQWARNTIRQCKAAGVACFVKQLGARPMFVAPEGLNQWHNNADLRRADGHVRIELKDRKGGDMSEWSHDLRVREFPR